MPWWGVSRTAMVCCRSTWPTTASVNMFFTVLPGGRCWDVMCPWMGCVEKFSTVAWICPVSSRWIITSRAVVGDVRDVHLDAGGDPVARADRQDVAAAGWRTSPGRRAGAAGTRTGSMPRGIPDGDSVACRPVVHQVVGGAVDPAGVPGAPAGRDS